MLAQAEYRTDFARHVSSGTWKKCKDIRAERRPKRRIAMDGFNVFQNLYTSISRLASDHFNSEFLFGVMIGVAVVWLLGGIVRWIGVRLEA
jgi:hypothetical protein